MSRFFVVCQHFLLNIKKAYGIFGLGGGDIVMKTRIKELRNALGLTQQEFANKMGTSRGNIAAYEVGKNAPSDAVVSLICREFNVNKDWLQAGIGEMFKEIPEEDETAALLSDLLEDNGETPLYETIKGIIRTYQQLDPKSQSILNDIIKKCYENIQKKEEN